MRSEEDRDARPPAHVLTNDEAAALRAEFPEPPHGSADLPTRCPCCDGDSDDWPEMAHNARVCVNCEHDWAGHA